MVERKSGAWIAVLAIPGLVLLMSVIRHHYEGILREVDDSSPARLSGIRPPIVVVPMKRWSKIAKKALRFAYALSQDIFVVHFEPIGPSGTQVGSELEAKWNQYIVHPAVDAGLLPPQLVVLQSRYRFVTTSIVKYILELERNHPQRTIAVVLPELVERHWFNYLLHDQRTLLLKLMLHIKGDGHIVVSGVPWYV